jgi:CBS domain-containing protein
MLRVRDIMTRDVFTVDATASAEDAAEALTRHGIGGAPVCDAEGALVGMLSKSDLVDPSSKDWIKGQATVSDVMNPNLLSFYADDPALAAVHGMSEHGIHRVVVYDADGKLAGIVTALDVVRAVARGMTFDADA